MKKIIISAAAFFIVGLCEAQVKKDTVMVDSTQAEKIKKMPMDTTHEKMPVVPLTPKDSTPPYRKGGDDADPKSPK